MKTPAASDLLPPGVAARQDRIAAVARRSARMEYAARIAGGFVLLAVVAMTVDGAFRLFHPAARWLVSLTVLTGLAAVGWRWWRGLGGRGSQTDAARAVEESVPGLQERWSTLASLGTEKNSLLRGAPGLLAKVRAEAESLADAVPVRTRAVKRGLNRTLLWSAAGVTALGVFHVADPGRASVLWHRLAAPWSDASLTKIRIVSHVPKAVTPRHELCELRASLSGRPVRDAVLFLKQGGTVTEIPVAADQLAAVPFTHVLRDPVDDFSFRFRAGDGQTPWHHVRVADRPVIQAASVTVTPPAYTGQPPEKHPGIPPRLRVLEGSRLSVRVAPGRSGDIVWLRTGAADGPRLPSEVTAGQFSTVLLTVSEGMRFFPLLVSPEGLENRMPPVCEVEVLPDRPPVVTLAADSATEAITPADTIEVAFTASDDVGIHGAEVVITIEKPGDAARELTVPIPLGDDKGARNLSRKIPLDLSALPLEPNAKISYAVRVKDGKAAAAEAGQKETEQEPEALAGNGKKKEEAGKAGKNEAPPVTMGKRELDLGQCTCSGAKNLEIEGYTGDSPAFREKKSLPVLPFLTKIKESADAALQFASNAKAGLKSGKADAPAAAALTAAEAKTESAGKQAAAFTKLMEGSAYAMIGLDVENLRAREFVPALAALAAAPAAADATPETDKAVMHLRAAVAWLGRLLAKAEQAAKEEEAAALAQKLKEMHRIFLEDSLALLKLAEGKGGAVPELPLIEVTREFAKLLEKKKQAEAEILKQLAALLAKDPELMAKFAVNRSKGADALQVQIADLAEEQEALNRRTGALAAAPAGGKPPPEFAGEKERRQWRIVEDLGGRLRAATAFFPKKLPRDSAEAKAFFDALLRAASLPAEEDGARLAALEAVTGTLDALGVLNGGASWAAKQRAILGEIRLRQEWLVEFASAVKANNPARAAGLLQRDLERRTRVLAAKVEHKLPVIAALSEDVAKTADAINAALADTALPAQSAAAGSLQKGAWKPAAPAQATALAGLEAASRGCAELVRLVAEEMKKNPPPPPGPGGPGAPESLETLLAMLEKEATVDEDFNLPEWKANIQIMSDWLSQCKSGAAGGPPVEKPGENPGDKPGKKPGDGADAAMAEQLRAAAERAKALAAAAAKAQREANEKARALAEAGHAEGDVPASAATARTGREGWNKPPSELSKDLQQRHATPPPEEYRHAVETYFRRIGAGGDGAEIR